ncbi:MAG: PhnD/SsuA/transferrin family substrate-binding protein [Gammaproteobacteria bacterium]|nr:PhnD/SsuA/transferrin family substrate-binding protein [Gammaproteobacteria bacterium]MBL6999358.1 PhnD/SsuA/transferrin family substrate-binding protein [Gammaproteobacteria bacterium]
MRVAKAILTTILLLKTGSLMAIDLSLSIQPVLPKADILKAYQPLADYLSAQTGHTIRIKAHNNFLTYWSSMRQKKGFDLVLDAAHFSDYRVAKMNYEVLAKLPDTVSFSVVTHDDNLIFDVDELVLQKVATMVSPSVGAVRLLNLFPDPMRQPRIIYARDSNDAAQKVLDKTVFAAIIPTALVSSFAGLNTVITTESLPHMAFSAAPEVAVSIRDKIRKALIEASSHAQGREMLSKLNFSAFEAASGKNYSGHKALLSHEIGY